MKKPSFFPLRGRKQETPAPEPLGAAKSDARAIARCSSSQARSLMPYQVAAKLNVLPLTVMSSFGQEMMVLACSRGGDVRFKREVQFACGREVKLVEVGSEVLSQAIFVAYHSDEEALNQQLKRITPQAPGRQEPLTLPQFRPETGQEAQFLASLIEYSIAQGASDLHLLPRHDGSHVKIRVNGELLSRSEPIGSLELHKYLVNRIKVLCSMDITARCKPQEGSFSVPAQEFCCSVRVSLMPTVQGEKAVLRFMGNSKLLSLEQLGFDTETLARLRETADSGEGAIVFVGATGSGKSTSMYALLKKLASSNLSLVSVEDPVELYLPEISQTSVDERAGLDYPTCLRSVLRQDPDVIMLGEIRDEVSAKMAFQAALTGHLLMTTVHARDVREAFLRVFGLGVDAVSLSQSLKMVIAQRLVPKLCERCKVVDLQESNILDFECYKPVGCVICDYTGFSGQALVCESLVLTPDLRESLAISKGEMPSAERLEDSSAYIPYSRGIQSLLRQGVIEKAACL